MFVDVEGIFFEEKVVVNVDEEVDSSKKEVGLLVNNIIKKVDEKLKVFVEDKNNFILKIELLK